MLKSKLVCLCTLFVFGAAAFAAPPKQETPLGPDSYLGNAGIFSLHKAPTGEQPDQNQLSRVGGDTCADATVIAGLPYVDVGTTVGYIDDYDEACPFVGSTSPDVVYAYTPAGDQTVTVTLCDMGPGGEWTDYDSKVYLYTGGCPGTVAGCNDDACSTPLFANFVSRIDQVALTGGETYYIVVDGYGGNSGNYVLTVTEFEPCGACPEGGTPEGEPACEDEWVDIYNGGCNSTPPVFGSIACGETVCGTAGTYLFGGNNYRDTDWYEFTVAFPSVLTWELVGDFPTRGFIIDGNLGCGTITILATDFGATCEPVSMSASVGPGTYWVFAGTNVFTGVPCGSEYVGTLTCETLGACCVDEVCSVVTESECAAMSGVFLPGEDCGTFTYEAATCEDQFMDISGTGTQLALTDDSGEVVPIGFSFNFFGVAHDDVAVCSNGYLTFGTDLTDFSEDPIPNTTDPNDLIAVLWDDLNPGQGGTVHYQTMGAEPDRVFIAQWTNVPEYFNTGSNTFQVFLYEGSNCVQFRYGSFDSADHVAGVESPDGTTGTDASALVAQNGCIMICGFAGENPCEGLEVTLSLDIKPGSCPNAFNRKSNGVLPTAILGTADFDVTTIDPESIVIGRADGVGGTAAPIRWSYEDVGTPFDGELCDCHELEGDGFLDLTLKFRTQEVVTALQLDQFPGGDTVELCVTGTLTDGTPFVACDCIWLVPPHGDPGLAP